MLLRISLFVSLFLPTRLECTHTRYTTIIHGKFEDLDIRSPTYIGLCLRKGRAKGDAFFFGLLRVIDFSRRKGGRGPYPVVCRELVFRSMM